MNSLAQFLKVTSLLGLLCTTAMAADVRPLQLDASQRAVVERTACRERHEVGVADIEARSYGRGVDAPAVAEVRCASHGVFMGNPMHYIVKCARERVDWECQGEWNEVLVTTGADSIPVRIEGDIPVGVSYQTIHKIANSGSFQGYPLREALAPPCYLHKGTAKEFIDIKCEGWHIIVSTWCPQSDCPRVISMTKLGL